MNMKKKDIKSIYLCENMNIQSVEMVDLRFCKLNEDEEGGFGILTVA